MGFIWQISRSVDRAPLQLSSQSNSGHANTHTYFMSWNHSHRSNHRHYFIFVLLTVFFFDIFISAHYCEFTPVQMVICFTLMSHDLWLWFCSFGNAIRAVCCLLFKTQKYYVISTWEWKVMKCNWTIVDNNLAAIEGVYCMNDQFVFRWIIRLSLWLRSSNCVGFLFFSLRQSN